MRPGHRKRGPDDDRAKKKPLPGERLRGGDDYEQSISPKPPYVNSGTNSAAGPASPRTRRPFAGCLLGSAGTSLATALRGRQGRTMKSPAERIAYKRRYVPELYRKSFDRCISGKASPREAIKMQCLECWAYVRSETATCDNYACPLWRYRPYQGAPDARPGDLSGVESTNGGGADE